MLRAAAMPAGIRAAARGRSTTPPPGSKSPHARYSAATADGDTLRTLLAALRRVLKVTPVDTIALRRQIADAVVARPGYPF